MIKQKKLVHIFILLCLDIISIILADATGIWIRTNPYFFEKDYALVAHGHYYEILTLVIPLFVFIYYIFKLYKAEIEIDVFNHIGKLFIANIIGAVVLMSITFIAKTGWIFSRFILFFFIIFNILYSTILRGIYRKILHIEYAKGKSIRKILVIGTGKLAEMYLNTIKEYSSWGYKPIGVLATNKESVGKKLSNVEVLGTLKDFYDLQNKHHFDEVVIALHIEESMDLRDILKMCDKEGVRIKIIPGYYEFLKLSTSVEDLDGLPILTIRGVPLDSVLNRAIKRAFDILFSLTAILITSPIMIFIAIGVKLSSPGPIFFKQERVGLNNKTFNMLKFRSMRVEDPNKEKFQWTTENDPRKTKFGSFIRKTSLDELPQFFNVLFGDMTIVGPRPERPYWVNKFKEEIPEYMLRHYAKAGITGWAQVNGWRGDTSIEERIKCDNYYIQNWSLWFDIKIIFMTIFKGFINKNAY